MCQLAEWGWGDMWLRDLPDLLEKCQENLSWNLILRAEKHDGTPVVVKISPF